MKKILALTLCCIDYFPEKGVIAAGGNSLNLAANCAKTGKADVYLMGNIGTDMYAEKIKEKADEYNINRDRLYEVDGATASNRLYHTMDGDRYEKEGSWDNGVYGDYEISADDEKFMKQFDAVAAIAWSPNFKHIIEISKNSDFLLAVDFSDHAPSEEWREFIPAIDLFFISAKKEDLFTYQKWSVEYPAVFVATLGKDGSMAYKDGAEYFCEAEKVAEVVDTTGCGDSYQGAFIVDYLLHRDVKSAMKAGAKAAAVTLSFVGAL